MFICRRLSQGPSPINKDPLARRHDRCRRPSSTRLWATDPLLQTNLGGESVLRGYNLASRHGSFRGLVRHVFQGRSIQGTFGQSLQGVRNKNRGAAFSKCAIADETRARGCGKEGLVQG